MSIIRRIKVLSAAQWWEKLSPDQKRTYLRQHPNSKVKLVAEHEGSGFYNIIHKATGERIGTVSRAGDHPFISSIRLVSHRGEGLAKHIYNALEKKIKRPIVPSPLGLSDNATRVWKKRLAKLPAEHAKQLLDESFKLGLTYGIKDPQHIIDRLQPLVPEWQPPK
jgi:hypothetical protein